MPEDFSCDLQSLVDLIGLCGSFLTLREGTIFFVLQSAKDSLLEKAFATIFPSGMEDAHYEVFSRSLQNLSRILRRDMYNLQVPGFPIERVKSPSSDPLATSRYPCIYWIDHLCVANPKLSGDHKTGLQTRIMVNTFMREKYLYWLEALSLCKSMSKGIHSMAKLDALVKKRADSSALMELTRDAHRFIMYYKWAIENSPLQAYVSALVFSPVHSLIRGLFKKEEPKWVAVQPSVRNALSACLLTLQGHSDMVSSVAFSNDSTRLASASDDKTVKIWDVSSGEYLQTLEGHSYTVSSVAFSNDSTRLASASEDGTVKIWDVTSGECQQTLEGHSNMVNLVAFSHDSTRLASASDDGTVKIWDVSSGECLQTLYGHSDWVRSVVFSHDPTRLASASDDKTVKIWDVSSGECLQTLYGHSGGVRSVAFSHDSTRLASASSDMTVKIWDVSSGECSQTLTIDKTLSNISFDTMDSCLHTEIGIIAIDTTSALQEGPNITDPQYPRRQGAGLSSGGAWITYNSENLLWLPSEYRPSCSAVSGTTVVIGPGSRRLLICDLELNCPDFPASRWKE